nr:transposase domain-containing protein [sulfur-oxidizing endosymbiont of Gigantopelta aegis]
MVYVLTQLPYADTVEKLEALLPWNFKKAELEKVKNAVR